MLSCVTSPPRQASPPRSRRPSHPPPNAIPAGCGSGSSGPWRRRATGWAWISARSSSAPYSRCCCCGRTTSCRWQTSATHCGAIPRRAPPARTSRSTSRCCAGSWGPAPTNRTVPARRCCAVRPDTPCASARTGSTRCGSRTWCGPGAAPRTAGTPRPPRHCSAARSGCGAVRCCRIWPTPRRCSPPRRARCASGTCRRSRTGSRRNWAWAGTTACWTCSTRWPAHTRCANACCTPG